MRVDTFVFVHDQDIVLDFDRIRKFADVENIKYVFLGERTIDKISGRSDLIVARDLPYNIEHLNKFVAFTGWYLIWMNKLSDADYVNLFEYDVILCENFVQKQKSVLTDKNVLGYQPINVHDYWYIGDEQCSSKLLSSVRDVYEIDYSDLVSRMSAHEVVSITSNHTFSKATFESFMQWFAPLVPLVQDEPMCGHFPERAVSIYCKTNDISFFIEESLLSHYRLDSHGTGGRDTTETSSLYKDLISVNSGSHG